MKNLVVGTLASMALAGAGTMTADQMQNPYIDRSTYYELPVTADISQGEHVEVAKTAPGVTLSRWNNEERVTITPILPGTGTVSAATRPLLSKELQYTKGSVTAFVQPSATSSDFDIDFKLAQKPASNVFSYTITGAADLSFYYQPALNSQPATAYPTPLTCTETLCVDADGKHVIEQPENVVGSYAVYSSAKRGHQIGSTNYGTGKLFHIYRPKAVDAAGKEIWATLAYSNGVLSVSVPQEFLDSATYPVVVDPTFGYTSVGAIAANYCQSYTFGNLFYSYTASSGDTVTGFTFSGKVNNGDVGTKSVGIALYTFSGGLPGTIVSTPVYTNISGGTFTWYNTASISQSLTGGTAYTLISSNCTDSNTMQAMDNISNSDSLDFTPGFHSPFSSGFVFTYLASMYATYTTGGGGGGGSPTTNPADTVLFE